MTFLTSKWPFWPDLAVQRKNERSFVLFACNYPENVYHMIFMRYLVIYTLRPFVTCTTLRRGSRISAREGAKGMMALYGMRMSDFWHTQTRFATFQDVYCHSMPEWCWTTIQETPVSLFSALETREPAPSARVLLSQGWAPAPAPPPPPGSAPDLTTDLCLDMHQTQAGTLQQLTGGQIP